MGWISETGKLSEFLQNFSSPKILLIILLTTAVAFDQTSCYANICEKNCECSSVRDI